MTKKKMLKMPPKQCMSKLLIGIRKGLEQLLAKKDNGFFPTVDFCMSELGRETE